jgi:hypothetical protein
VDFLALIIRNLIAEYFLGSVGFVVLKIITFGKYKHSFKQSLSYPNIFFVDIVGLITLCVFVYILVQL